MLIEKFNFGAVFPFFGPASIARFLGRLVVRPAGPSNPPPTNCPRICVWWAGEVQRIIRQQEQARDAEQSLDEALE